MKASKKIIYLQPIGNIDKSILIRLMEDLSIIMREFNLSVEISPEKIELEDDQFNERRGQYSASDILNKINETVDNGKYYRLLGVVDEDIYTEGLNFVFGVARMSRYVKNVGAALISITRLRETFYGRSEDESIFHLRVVKEAVHELGHTFGLEHCKNECIMRFSNHLGETDDKPLNFCNSCTENLMNYFKN